MFRRIRREFGNLLALKRAGSTVVEIDSAHAVPVTRPVETADLITAVAGTA